jgi:hypothetical protein
MRFLYSALIISLITLACSSGRGDPIVPGSDGPSPGAGRTNLAVVESNQYDALQVFFEMIQDNYSKAVNITINANDPATQVRILGNYDGYAIVSRINPDNSASSAPHSWDLEIDYTGYFSDNGMQYISGKLELYGKVSETTYRLTEFDLSGTVDFSGDYACSVKFEGFRMALDANGKAIDLPYTYEKYLVCGPTFSLPGYGIVTITSEGAPTLRSNPYDFDRIVLENPPPSTREDSIQFGCYP